MPVQLDLNNFHEQSPEVKEAIAFYTVSTTYSLQFSAEQRLQHYKVLENAGFLERVGASNE